jgi:hypothetical protein
MIDPDQQGDQKSLIVDREDGTGANAELRQASSRCAPGRAPNADA